MNKLKEYLEQDIWKPRYLFHGSPYEIDILEPRKSTDTKNKENEDNAIFLTSWFINATAYAFRNKLKEMNEHYNFKMNKNGELPAMNFQVENLPDDLYGYVYVFNEDVVKVYYKDFADYFSRESLQKSK